MLQEQRERMDYLVSYDSAKTRHDPREIRQWRIVAWIIVLPLRRRHDFLSESTPSIHRANSPQPTRTEREKFIPRARKRSERVLGALDVGDLFGVALLAGIEAGDHELMRYSLRRGVGLRGIT
jgi:hypothetical protein